MKMAMDGQYKKLGELLKAQGLIDTDQLDLALKAQTKSGAPLGSILVKEMLISEASLAKALAFQKNLELVDLNEYDIDPRATATVNEEVARRYKIIPIDFNQGRLVVAVANPLDVHALDSMSVITGLKIEPVVATETAISEAINNYITGPSQIKETVEEAAKTTDFFDAVDDALMIDEDVPVVKLANTILAQAFRQRASDVHIECAERLIRVRYRVDGVLREAMKLPEHLKSLLISRFKIMSGMDISERRRPQDGRISVKIDGQEVQLRVATLPGVYGENVVLRLLSSAKTLIELDALGLDDDMLETYRQAFSRSYGAILVTGPTGSGKTTTLYAMLNELNTPEKKIITIEDPIEYSLGSLTQIQINRKAGIDFSTGLRSIVRADPDIIMVGEIRDLETAQISVRAALTGHLVLTSLHTNDAASALTRLVDMGVDNFLVASAVKCVVAQRLTRVLCRHCKAPVEYDADKLARLGIDGEAAEFQFFEPKGCRRCQQTGYHGRIGIFELLMVTEEIDKMCIAGASSADIRNAAIDAGMRTLYLDGLIKAGQGRISVDEVKRVVL